MAAQASTGSVADLKFLDQDRIFETTLVEITECLGVAIELLLIESSSLLKHGGRVGFWTGLWIQAGEALVERQLAG